MSLGTLITISPTTNKPIVTKAGLSEEELKLLPVTAAEAFKSFRNTALEERQNVVRKALNLLEKKKDELAKELTEQMGRPISYTAKEISTAVARGSYLLKISGETLQDTPGETESGFQRYIKKLPVGPTLIIFAWNVSGLSPSCQSVSPDHIQYPYLILVNALIPAILAGNSVILKPSPQTPTIVEHIQHIFLEAGLPPNVIQYFHSGSNLQTEAVIRSPEIQLVCFTGSVAGGLAVQKAASDRVSVRVGLELGGNDPAYIRSDVDLKWAAEEIVDGAIFNSGQSCCSIERVYVAQDIHDEFVAAVQDVLKGYILGDPFDSKTHLGPVISKRSAETIKTHVKDAIEKGAKDVTPENESFKSPPPDGNFVAPIVLTGVTHDMLVMKDETFGPVIPIMKVKSDGEAISLMNDSQYGLTASIWTKDVEKGHQLVDEVEAGTVFVNRADYPSPVSFNGKGSLYELTGGIRIWHGLDGRTLERARPSVASASISSFASRVSTSRTTPNEAAMQRIYYCVYSFVVNVLASTLCGIPQ
jgi:acyl-CoA reductase-like NAD-dependent aldehyde dehydrogenase